MRMPGKLSLCAKMSEWDNTLLGSPEAAFKRRLMGVLEHPEPPPGYATGHSAHSGDKHSHPNTLCIRLYILFTVGVSRLNLQLPLMVHLWQLGSGGGYWLNNTFNISGNNIYTATRHFTS